MSAASGDALEGIVREIVYRAPEGSWSVLRVEVGGDAGAAGRSAVHTAVGHFTGVHPGEHLRMRGRWEHHARFGEQFRVESFVTLRPDTLVGMERYLGSGLIPGLGPVMARRLVEAFGTETLEVLDGAGERLVEVDGIGPKRRQSILEVWSEHRHVGETMVFLRTHGISAALASRIHRAFGSAAGEIVRRDPFRLVAEVRGVGFATADRIAAELGIPPDSPQRVEAGLRHVLEGSAERGDLHLPVAELTDRTVQLLEVSPGAVERGIDELAEARALTRLEKEERELIALPELVEAEVTASVRLHALLRSTPRRRAFPGDALEGLARSACGADLGAAQVRAVELSRTSKVLVVTGGPGTGKTTLVRAIAHLFEASGARLLLAAPTGRAARRLGEATGREASTLHRMLEFQPREDRFLRDADRPLVADLVVVDEVSMIDALLFRHLLVALRDETRLILVGDADQLPSVGPGQVLRDLIESGRVPAVQLDEVFRQAGRSLIVRNAHRILRGELPCDARAVEEGGDFFVVERERPESILELIDELVARRIPQRFGLDPLRDVQVLAPMHRGELGVSQLNRRLQERLNPLSEVAEALGSEGQLRTGDRVIQLRNNYDLDVFNGDVGRVLAIDRASRTVTVEYDGRRVIYGRGEIEELGLAYALSIHKAQGSEYPAVVLPLHTQHYVLLQRNLLYTAVTRGRRLVVVVGTRRALELAVANDRVHLRRTLLGSLLRRGEESASQGAFEP